MGWTVLYIAFGVVALWLLGEVLLQYKARLRWRLLAFAGFLCVVVGVLMPSVLVIALGTAAFAVGQTFVTLSFRRGFAAGWAVSRPGPGAESGAKRRRGRAERKKKGEDPESAGLDTADGYGTGHADADGAHLEDGTDPATGADAPPGHDVPAYGHDDDYDRDDVFAPARPLQAAGDDATAVYEPQPLPDDTGSYGVYDPRPAQDQYATAAQGADQGYGYDYSGYGQQGYGYDGAGQGYTGYTDPYLGDQSGYGGASYDPSYGQGGAQAPYTTGGYGGETPAAGVWVPQQRADDPHGGALPPEQQPYPYQGDGQNQNPAPHAPGYDEQYRF
ncbi:SCO2102 family sporulation regulator [Streptomyces sennicomposti]|uniref:SCO2102 family sporulation regulator n=1 Tax=Streptomyces sennicomposti TaxID=2873384 RepID=UPI001CA6C4F8|nr:hypothetical protein [Streptomyces sennicomposti]MBY8865192.1 hypothetical protein [Streptomyces sennicomposti]